MKTHLATYLELGKVRIASLAALNPVQERELNGLMRRTMGRPPPSGRVDVPYALAVSVATVAAGSAMIYLGSNLLATALGLVTVLWYNGAYTPLKRMSAFAVVPGGVVGAMDLCDRTHVC